MEWLFMLHNDQALAEIYLVWIFNHKYKDAQNIALLYYKTDVSLNVNS